MSVWRRETEDCLFLPPLGWSQMYTCEADKRSAKGWTSRLVVKLKISPKVMEMGRAGNAFLKMAKSRRVKHSPCKQNNQWSVS